MNWRGSQKQKRLMENILLMKEYTRKHETCSASN
jgi:hypothetical protein